MNGSRVQPLRQVITSEQIQKRVKELGRQISDDYKGQTIQMLAVLENAFMFLADLVRSVDVPVVCQFIKPRYSKPQASARDVMEIFFSHEPEIKGQHILLVEGLVHSGDHQRIPDERSPRQGRSVRQAGDAARSPVGPSSPFATRLFWLPGG